MPAPKAALCSTSSALPGVVNNQEAQLYLRPHEVQLAKAPAAHARLPLRIEAISLIGSEVRIELAPEGWESNEIWEVGMSHGEFARHNPTVPAIGSD